MFLQRSGKVVFAAIPGNSPGDLDIPVHQTKDNWCHLWSGLICIQIAVSRTTKSNL